MSDQTDEVTALEESAPALPWWQGLNVPIVYTVDHETGEYIGTAQADPSPLEVGVWLIPALAYPDAPPDSLEGWARVRKGGAWCQVVDHRGSIVYNTATQEPKEWTALGDIATGWTLTAPATEFDVWIDGEWVLDRVARTAELMRRAAQKKSLLIQYAGAQIAILQDAVDMKVATDAEANALAQWKTFRIELNRLDTASSVPASSAWPQSPDVAATNRWLTSQDYEDLETSE